MEDLKNPRNNKQHDANDGTQLTRKILINHPNDNQTGLWQVTPDINRTCHQSITHYLQIRTWDYQPQWYYIRHHDSTKQHVQIRQSHSTPSSNTDEDNSSSGQKHATILNYGRDTTAVIVNGYENFNHSSELNMQSCEKILRVSKPDDSFYSSRGSAENLDSEMKTHVTKIILLMNLTRKGVLQEKKFLSQNTILMMESLDLFLRTWYQKKAILVVR
jgi:hypothetical protein